MFAKPAATVPEHNEVLKVYASLIEAGAKAIKLIHERPTSEAAAKAFDALEVANAELEKGVAAK